MSNTTPLEFSVPGISCDHCKNAIEGEVSDVAGVSDVTVDVDAKTVRVIGGERDAIVEAIDEAGYDIV